MTNGYSQAQAREDAFMKNRMHLEIHNSKNMTTSKVLSVLDEVSTASSGPETKQPRVLTQQQQ